MTALAATADLERLSTGSVEFDAILGGGLPRQSVTVLAGEPGSGKTVVTMQMLFHLARAGHKCLYFTTLSEPPTKLIRYMQRFPFFDTNLIGDRLVLADIGSTLREKQMDETLGVLIERVEAEEPDVVVIDSFKAIHDLLDETFAARRFAYDLGVHFSTWGVTTLLVGEYSLAEVASAPVFAIADGIIRLQNVTQKLTAHREVEVLKMRGSDSIGGRHFFDVGSGGAVFYPRVRVPESALDDQPLDLGDRVATGTAGLDDLFHGGVPRYSATLVEGGTGLGKTLMSLQFLLEGVRRGERGVYFSLEETPAHLRAVAWGFGWDLGALEAQGLLTIRYTSPVELSPDRFLNRALQELDATQAQRAVLDSLTGLAMGIPSDRRYRELVYAITKHVAARRVCLFMTIEIAELLGAAQLTGHGVSSIADNVVLLRYVELGGRLARAMSVLKARGVQHETDLRQFTISAQGLTVGSAFTALRGVLTGLPQDVSDFRPGSSETRSD